MKGFIEVGDRVRIEAPLKGDTDIYEGREGVVISIADDRVDVRFDIGYKKLSGMFPMQRLRKIGHHELQIGDVVRVEYYPLDLRYAHELCQGAIAIITGFDTTDTGVRRAILKQGNIEDRVGIENLIYLRPSKLCIGDPIWVKEMPDPAVFKIGDKVIVTLETPDGEQAYEHVVCETYRDETSGTIVVVDHGQARFPISQVKHHPDSVFYFDTRVLKFERNDKGETLVITYRYDCESGGNCPLSNVELNLEELAVRVGEQLRAVADIEPNPITIQEVEKALEIKAKRTYTITAATLEREMSIPFGRAQKIMDALCQAQKEGE